MDKLGENDVLAFISAIENRPLVWNYRLPDYHKRRGKEMEEVAKAFGITGKFQN